MTLNYLRKVFSSGIMCRLTKLHRTSQTPQIRHFVRHSPVRRDYYWTEDNEMDFDALTDNRWDLKKKLKIIRLEIYEYRGDLANPPIPEKLKFFDYKILLTLPTEQIRRRYLEELGKYIERIKVKKEKYGEERYDEEKNYNIPNHIWYGIGHNCLSLKYYEEDFADILSTVSCATMLYSNDIVIDLSYEDEMEYNEMSVCAMELQRVLHHNQMTKAPFNIHLCNVKKDGKMSKLFNSKFNVNIQNLPINVHEKSYLDIFPRHKLVYLSPHAKDEVIHFDYNHIYILGAVFDKVPFDSPFSHKKALSENLDVRRFPVDEFVNWKQGSKTFGLHMSFKILADVNYYKKWDKGFENLNLKFIENRKSQRYVGQFRNILTALDKKIL